MSDRPDRRYVDHPAPSVGLMGILLLASCALIAAIAPLLHVPAREEPSLFPLAGRAVILLILAILCFYLWPLYSTYYTVSSAGIQVRYGPWSRQYPWTDFTTVYWQKGLFATRIGWPSVTIRSVPDPQRFESFPSENR